MIVLLPFARLTGLLQSWKMDDADAASVMAEYGTGGEIDVDDLISMLKLYEYN